MYLLFWINFGLILVHSLFWSLWPKFCRNLISKGAARRLLSLRTLTWNVTWDYGMKYERTQFRGGWTDGAPQHIMVSTRMELSQSSIQWNSTVNQHNFYLQLLSFHQESWLSAVHQTLTVGSEHRNFIQILSIILNIDSFRLAELPRAWNKLRRLCNWTLMPWQRNACRPLRLGSFTCKNIGTSLLSTY